MRLLYLAQTIGLLISLGVAASTSQAQQKPPVPRRPQVILGPSAIYGRGYSPALPRAAGFSYQAGHAPPLVVPNYTYPSYRTSYGSGPSFMSGPTMPYGAVVYGSTYPGYGFGFGSGYGSLGYNFNYPGTTVGMGYMGATFPPAGTGFVAPNWYFQQMQGYFGR